MEKTLVILKPSCVQKALIGEVISRFEKKGLQLIGMKMMQLDDDILNVHYAHLKDEPFFDCLKQSMKATPVVVQCWQGYDAALVVRKMIGVTNGREAEAGTVRGDYSLSSQQNIVHASDSTASAEEELKRFFKKEEIFDYNQTNAPFLYSKEELL